MSKQYNYFIYYNTSSFTDIRESNKFSHTYFPKNRYVKMFYYDFIFDSRTINLTWQRNSVDDRLKNFITNNTGDPAVSVGYAITMKYRKTLRKIAAACLLEVREMNLRGRHYARGSITYSRLSYNVTDCRNFPLPADTPCTRHGLIKITRCN